MSNPVEVDADQPHFDDATTLRELDAGAARLMAHVLSAFPGAVIASVTTDAPAPRPVTEQHGPGEHFFGPMGPVLVKKGWSVFPQSRTDRRGPGIVDGHALRWKEYGTRLPTESEVRWWAISCPQHNVAAIMGKASGGALALDIDVGDVATSHAIQALATEHLGVPGFVRTGRYPRIALLYRQEIDPEVGDGHGEIPNRSWRFADDSLGGIEILARGKPITFYGNHHKTGRYFRWSGIHPMEAGPEHAPVVTRAQLERFVEAVQGIAAFARRGAVSVDDTRWTYDPASGLHAPRAMSSEGWTLDADGRVTDGREDFLFRLAANVVRRNEGACRGGREGLLAICALVEERFRALAVVDGRWERDLKGEVLDKSQRLVREALEKGGRGERAWQSPLSVNPEIGVATFPEASTAAAVPVAAAKSNDLAWASEAVRKAAAGLVNARLPAMAVTPATPESAAAAAMMPRDERYETGQKAAAQVAAAVDEAFRFAYAHPNGGWRPPEDDSKARLPLHALIAPTGAGKTRAAIRAKIRARAAHPHLAVCTAILVPTHANAAEISEAVERHEQEIAESKAEAEAAGMTVLHFKGRIAAGCGHADTMEALYAAGLPGSRLCRTADRHPITKEVEERFCQFWEGCRHRLSLAELKSGKVDLVLMPHAYLSGPMAKEITDAVHNVVVDETHWRTVSGTKTFPIEVLSHARAMPRFTKKEREEIEARGGQADPAEFVMMRDEAVRVLLDARDRGLDPARAFLALSRRKDMGWDDKGVDLISAASRCVDATRNAGRHIHPEMSEAEVARAVDVAQAEHADGEGVLWKLVGDRLDDLIKDRHDAEMHAAAMAVGGDVPAPQPRVLSPVDTRVQFGVMIDEATRRQVESVRVTYWRRRNFLGLPTLLIDASLSERITEQAWPGRDIVLTRVDAPAHVHTILVADGTGSDSQVMASRSAGKARAHAAARAALLVSLGSRMAAMYGNSGVLEAYTKAVRGMIEHVRVASPNTSVLHEGNVRGYNFAEMYAALLSYGRLEYPIQAIDAHKALFTYNDPSPEQPWDTYGTGFQKDGKTPIPLPKGPRTITMRDGSKRTYEDTMFPEGSWAREVQIQLREEELRQTLGRLRPVYRIDSDAVWVNVGRCVPEGVIVDEIVTLGDLSRPERRDDIFEAARRMHGVVSAVVAKQVLPDMRFVRVGDTDLAGVVDRLTPREREALVPVRWRVRGRAEPVEHLMINSSPDLEAAADEFGRMRGEEMEPGTFEVVGGRPERVRIGHKRPDKMDLERVGMTAGEAQDIEDERGLEGLVAQVRQIDREREDALRARSLKRATRIMGHAPAGHHWDGLPISDNIPRSQARCSLAERILIDAAEDKASNGGLID